MEPTRTKEEIIKFYEKLNIETAEWRPAGNIYNCPITTSEAEKEALQENFDEQEVYNCLKMCVADKAPGLDCYTMVFFSVRRY